MARKEITYTVSDEGRDKGKKFLITEMSARKAEEFALRAFSSAVACGIKNDKTDPSQGMLALAKIGYALIVTMPYEYSQPLLDQLMSCVKIQEQHITRDVLEVDVEEVATYLKLKKAAYDLHVSFFTDGGLSTSGSDQSARKENTLTIKPRPTR